MVASHDQTCPCKKLYLIKHLLKRSVGLLETVALVTPAFRLGSLFSPLLSVKGRGHFPDDAATNVLPDNTPIYFPATGVVRAAPFSLFPTHPYGIRRWQRAN